MFRALRFASPFTALGVAWLILAPVHLEAQRGGGRGGPPPAPREAAAVDLTAAGWDPAPCPAS